MTEKSGGWQNFAKGFERLGAPLRPSVSDVESLRGAIAGSDERVLLLGVTPELTGLGKKMVAVDKEPGMIADVWPGDDHRRRAVLANWLDLPFDDASFDAAIGDGSMNAVAGCREELLVEVRRVLAPAGILALRVFCSPESPETLRDIRRELEEGWNGNVYSLAWRIAMSLAPDKADAVVAVREVAQTFNELFPDRDAVAAKTGWNAAEIAFFDRLEAGAHSVGLPTLDTAVELLQRTFPQYRVIPGSGYPLAERCPTIVCSGGP